MPRATWRIIPARVSSLWLTTSASAGSSFKVGAKRAEKRTRVVYIAIRAVATAGARSRPHARRKDGPPCVTLLRARGGGPHVREPNQLLQGRSARASLHALGAPARAAALRLPALLARRSRRVRRDARAGAPDRERDPRAAERDRRSPRLRLRARQGHDASGFRDAWKQLFDLGITAFAGDPDEGGLGAPLAVDVVVQEM